tara:strand:- start:1117 stop:3063 length:1947 start_codon:yes stop_codon:yes gene_type:complete
MIENIKKEIIFIKRLPRAIKIFMAIMIDASCCILSIWLAYYLRLGVFVSFFEKTGIACLLSLCFSIPIFIAFGLYRAIFRYSGLPALFTVFKAILIYALIFFGFITQTRMLFIPRTIGLIQPLILLLLIVSWRMLLAYLLSGAYQKQFNRFNIKNVLVFGAGEAGRQLYKAMQGSNEINIKGFIDDDVSKQGFYLDGKPVISNDKLENFISYKNISLILLAIPSVERTRRNEIIKNLRHLNIEVRTIPSISELAKGSASITDFFALDIDDLLGRDEVEASSYLMKKNIKGKVILVSGAGGSIGSELCLQAVNLNPTKILLIENSEYALYLITSRLNELMNKLSLRDIEIVPLLANVLDEKRINNIISIWKPYIIFHTAAYKHVPIVEHNLIEGIKNNSIATLKLAKIAINNETPNFVFISTDKAVRPTNIMGASKRLAEISLQAIFHNQIKDFNKNNFTKISMVRFGNVLESSGSVIPIFREQIKNGGPITLTDLNITRYFMTIKEAAQLVIQSSALAKGGEVFLLDMGKPVKIYDLAIKMIELSGHSLKDELNPNGDIEIEITGLRPGEKLYEELLLSGNPSVTKHSKIFRSKEPFIKWFELEPKLNDLNYYLKDNDYVNIIRILKEIIKDYSSEKVIVDYTFPKNE